MQLSDIATLKGAIERLVGNTASTEDRNQVQAALNADILSIATGERAVAVGGDANGAVIMTGDGNVVLRIEVSAAAAINREIQVGMNCGVGPRARCQWA